MLFLKISMNSQENTWIGVSSLEKLQGGGGLQLYCERLSTVDLWTAVNTLS